MAHITGGSVYFMRRVKTGDYEHKEAKVEMTVSVAEDESHCGAFDRATMEAVSRAEAMLGIRPRATVAPEHDPKPVVEEVPPVAPVAEKPAKRAPKVKSEPVVITGQSGVAAVTTELEPGVKVVTENVDWDGPSDVATEATTAAEPPVTDDEITRACAKHFAETKNSPPIRELIYRYLGKQGQARQIEASKRRAFLLELSKVPALATA